MNPNSLHQCQKTNPQNRFHHKLPLPPPPNNSHVLRNNLQKFRLISVCYGHRYSLFQLFFSDALYQETYKQLSLQYSNVEKALQKSLNTINTSLTTITPLLQEASESLVKTKANIEQTSKLLQQLNDSMIIW